MKPLGPGDPTAVAAYRLLGVLGGGGMGRVYLGQSLTGRRVAIKVIRAELAEDPVFRRRFAREVSAARSVNPLVTAAVVDADTDAASPWLATTFIDGPSLAQRVNAHGPLAPAAVLTLAAGLAEALASIHQVGLVHRDLKPSNVLLDHTGPHIIDFGIARSSDASRLTMSLVVGTPSYMAPERLRGKQAGPAGDIFALGATLVFAATGRNLVADDTMYAQAMQIIKGRFDLSAVPRPLRPFIVRCIGLEPKDRPTAAELTRILVASGAMAAVPGWYGEDPRPPLPMITVPPSPRYARRAVLTLGGAAGLVAVGGGVSAASTMFTRPLTDPQDLRQSEAMALAQARATSASPQAKTTSTPARRVLWQAASPSRPRGARVLPDRRGVLITAAPAEVTATGMAGNRLWTHSIAANPAQVRRWGDGVLVSGANQLFYFDVATGTQRFCIDTAIAVPRTAVSADRVFAQTGTSLIAADRHGRRLWRATGGLAMGTPMAATPQWLLVQDITGLDTRRVGLRDTRTNKMRWSTRYDLRSVVEEPPPPPDGGPGGPPPGRDDAWQRAEARIGEQHVVIRDAEHVRVLRLTDGHPLWQYTSARPVVAVELVGELVVIAADQITAHRVETGEQVWEAPLRGARIAPAATGIVAAAEHEITLLDPAAGTSRWREPFPQVTDGGMPEELVVDGDAALVTFRQRPEHPSPLDVDVIAFSTSS